MRNAKFFSTYSTTSLPINANSGMYSQHLLCEASSGYVTLSNPQPGSMCASP